MVCSGNICRSPMAAEYLRHRAARDGLAHLVVASAGTLGIEGETASLQAVRAMEELGLDLSAHRSKGIAATDLVSADLVIAMSHDHLVELAHRFPDVGGERYLLRAFEDGPDPASDPRDLEDPIGRPIEVYREQLSIVRRLRPPGHWLSLRAS